MLYAFGGNTGETPDTIKQKREIARALLASRTPTNIGEGLNALGDGIVAAVMNSRANEAEKTGLDSASMDFAPFFSPNNLPSAPVPAATAPPANTASDGVTKVDLPPPGSMEAARVSDRASDPNYDASPVAKALAGNSPLPQSFLAAVDKTEGNGGYDTLFGNAQKRGQFAGTDVSKMKIADVMAFTDPRGPYAQTVKDQIGRVATPTGRYQIVGTTLRNAVRDMGLDPNATFSPEVQDAIALHLAQNRVNSADSTGGKIAALRNEWDGFKNVPDSQLAQIAQDISGSPAPNATAFAPQPSGNDAVDAINSIAPQTGSRDPIVSAPNYNPSAPAPSPVAMALASPQGSPSAGVQPSGGVQVAQNNVGAPVSSDAGKSAVVRALAGQSSNVQPGYFPAAPNQPGQSGLSRAQIVRALTNPFASDEQKMIAKDQYQRMVEANDPSTQLDLEYKRAQLEALKGKKAKNWQKLDDTTLYDPDSGETKKVGGPAPGGFRFSGTSVEAQGLNGLLDTGKITPEQAQQIAAGKTITGPNGEVIFMTPQGIFSQQPGQTPAPVQGQGSGIDIFAGSQPAASAPARPDVSNGIELTGPKKPTVDEKNAMTYADRMTNSGALIDNLGEAGLSKKDEMLSHIPFGLGNYAVSEDYQRLDQAKRDFINAQLRRESGAVISPSEFDNAEKQYFPQPGDSPELVKQKAENRRLAVEGMIRDAGPTYKRMTPGSAAPKAGDDGWTEISPGVRIRKAN